MATRDDHTKSRASLLSEVRRLRALLGDNEALQRAVQELETHREELRSQHAELLLAKDLLEESRDAYANLFDFAPVGYAVLNATGLIEDINLSGAVLLGTTRQRALRFPLHTFVVPEDRPRFLDYMRQCRETSGPIVEQEITLQTRRGERVPVQLRTKVTEADHRKLHMTIVDLRERERIEAERQHADEERRRLEHGEQLARAASDAKDHFLAMLSHELRTPLTPLLFAIASLRRAGTVPEALTPTLDIIERNVKLEARLIDDLLDVTRIAQGKLRLTLSTVDVHVVLEEVTALLHEQAQRYGVELSLALDAPVHRVRGDDTRLRQVVLNLLTNALRHASPRGSVRVRTDAGTSGRLLLEVIDDGEGIPAEMLERVFHPFEQYRGAARSTGGLGLGLSICKGIVEAHGGTIAAASEGRGTGACFTVELPTIAVPTLVRVPAPDPRPAIHHCGKILLVEDNEDNALSMAGLLRTVGYEVEVAGSVAGALRAAERGFDVLLCDIGLPDGSGRDVVRALAARGPVQAVALTGYGSERDVHQNRDAGFVRHLTKPVDPPELMRTIDELIGRDPIAPAAGAAPAHRRRP